MTFLDSFLNLMPVTLLQGVIYSLVALGIMIPFRLLSFPDLTAEGSFPLGASLAAAIIAAGHDPVLASWIAVLGGFAAGAATAGIHLALRLNTLLCGILVLTMLFSINIRIMGKPNVGLFMYADIFALLGPLAQGLAARIALVGILVLGVAGALFWFLKTEAGMALRAVGASQTMARAQGISVAFHTVLGLGLAGALCAGSGAIMAQNQAFADVNMGFGTLVNGLAAVIVGEQFLGRHTLARQIGAPILGALIYFQVVSFALALGLEPSDLKLLTGAFVLVMLLVPRLQGRQESLGRNV